MTLEGEPCPHERLVAEQFVDHPELGCHVEIRESDDWGEWHRVARRGHAYSDNVLINFHGQTTSFDYHPVSEHHLSYLIDLTGEPTGIRLMLPARTRLVENEAFELLKQALELEAFRYLQRRGHHRLPYKEYLRARELGIESPEAKPTFSVGLLSGSESPEPVEVVMPEGFPLAECYRLDPDYPEGHETDEANVHLLAALGQFEKPFVPVDIRSSYDGYSWAKLPLIQKVEVAVGKELHQEWLWGGTLTCVETITVTAHATDGRVFSSPVCLARAPEPPRNAAAWATDHVFVTPAAQQGLRPSEIWYHLGGWSDEGDTYDTQQREFEEQLDHFWMRLVGPDEQLRRSILSAVEGLQPTCRSVTISSGGTVTLRFTDGSERTLRAPAP
ncbi:MAG: hypothetical protein V2A79_00020 [Planctomycetota bacterium]